MSRLYVLLWVKLKDPGDATPWKEPTRIRGLRDVRGTPEWIEGGGFPPVPIVNPLDLRLIGNTLYELLIFRSYIVRRCINPRRPPLHQLPDFIHRRMKTIPTTIKFSTPAARLLCHYSALAPCTIAVLLLKTPPKAMAVFLLLASTIIPVFLSLRRVCHG